MMSRCARIEEIFCDNGADTETINFHPDAWHKAHAAIAHSKGRPYEWGEEDDDE